MTMSAAMIVRGICIRDSTPSCMRAPPEAGTAISAASCNTASLAAASNASPAASPIEPPMNPNSNAATTAACPPIRPCATTTASLPGRVPSAPPSADRCSAGGRGNAAGRRRSSAARFASRRRRRTGSADAGGADAQMMAAIAADMEIGLELAVEQHLLAGWAFLPQIVRRPLLADDRADFGQDKIGEPAHSVFLVERCAGEIGSNGEPLQYQSHPLSGAAGALALLRERAAIAQRRSPRLEHGKAETGKREMLGRISGPPLAEAVSSQPGESGLCAAVVSSPAAASCVCPSAPSSTCSLAFVAVATVGVFFGLGFCLMIQHPAAGATAKPAASAEATPIPADATRPPATPATALPAAAAATSSARNSGEGAGGRRSSPRADAPAVVGAASSGIADRATGSAVAALARMAPPDTAAAQQAAKPSAAPPAVAQAIEPAPLRR